MSIQRIKQQLPSTPAFVLDQQAVLSRARRLVALKTLCGCKVLYAIKALPVARVMQWLKPFVDGFSVSSLYEARLAQEVWGSPGGIHLTTPGIRAAELPELMRLCSHISFNSLSQWQRFAVGGGASLGLRINPKLSFACDARYDPCRAHSKLGVDLNTFDAHLYPDVEGLHIHTVFGATDFTPMLQGVAALREKMGDRFASLKWLNLGGGYLYNHIKDLSPFVQLVNTLHAEFGLEVIIEPGNDLVGQAGYLVSSVVDCFMSDGKHLAVLDTAVNHHPEVFEYQKQPPVIGQAATGEPPVTLVGSTCLAGDLFGEYTFAKALQLGDRVVFEDVGAYALIKASRFNGYPLPDIYAWQDGQLTLLASDSYAVYRQQWFI